MRRALLILSLVVAVALCAYGLMIDAPPLWRAVPGLLGLGLAAASYALWRGALPAYLTAAWAFLGGVLVEPLAGLLDDAMTHPMLDFNVPLLITGLAMVLALVGLVLSLRVSHT